MEVKSNEYYLIDYYSPDGLNKLEAGYNGLFSSSGIRVYHVDATLTTEEIYSALDIYKYNNSDIVLDADDYWINKEHIQNALDFLEKNTDYTMYTTGLYFKYNNGQIIEQSKVKKSTFSNKNIKKIPLCHTSNTVFRNVWNISDVEEISKMSLANKQSFRGDSFRKFYAINHGKCYLDDNFDSVYRISGEGIWSHLKQRQKILLEIRLHINMMKFFNLKNARFHMEYLHKMVGYFCEYGNDVVSNNDANEFLVYLKDYILI